MGLFDLANYPLLKINRKDKDIGGFMLTKNTGKLCVLLFLLSIMVVFTACGIHGDPKVNQNPSIRITSYTGNDSLLVDRAVPFQQTIYWAAEDVDGVIAGYAYRILNINGEPISTPGNSVVDINGDITPENLKALHGNGWVIHYQKGAPEAYPLDNPNAKRTVWTEKVFTVVNFPANVNGDSAHVASKFEVVAIDNRGGISDKATKYFYTTSANSSILLSSTRGNLENAEIGQGVKILFRMKDAMVGVVPTRPWYYMYRLYRVSDTDTTQILHDYGWFDTRDQEKIDEIVLTGTSNPSLQKNYENGTKVSATIIQAKVVDLAGVVSKPVSAKFYVDDKYSPQTMIYTTHSYALGDNHFVLRQDTNNTDVPPNSNSPEGVRIASNFTAAPVLNENGEVVDYEWTVVGNEQTRFWFRWGYRGEYISNNPNNKAENIVRDSTGTTGVNYLSEISYFHVQLNGEQYNFGPLQQPGMQPRPDWLRIPANHEISQRISFNGLHPGVHVLKVAAEDLQGKIDPTPAVFRFRVVAPNTPAERNGVLYISNNVNANPELIQYYRDIMPAGMPVTFLHRSSLRATFNSQYSSFYIRDGKHLFPNSLLQNYKYVIYATDSGNYSSNLSMVEDFDGFRLFMRNQGNVILVGNMNLAVLHEDFVDKNNNFFLSDFFGFPRDYTKVRSLTRQITNRQYYFTGATPLEGFPTANAEIEDNPDSIIRNLVATRQGLPSVTYFTDESYTASPLYLFNCKTVGQDNFSPETDEERALYQGKAVALRKTNGQGAGYTFGFPLYHMNKDHARAILARILQ